MSSLARIEELEKKFAESPRRFFAPLANEYRKAGDAARAIEMCRAHLEQQPNHMSGQVVLGQALFDAGQKQDAREAFEVALSLDPENLIALRHLGDMARETGDYPAAKKWYMQVLDVDSRNHEVITVVREIDEIVAAESFASSDKPAEAREPEIAEPQVEEIGAAATDPAVSDSAVSDPVSTESAIPDFATTDSNERSAEQQPSPAVVQVATIEESAIVFAEDGNAIAFTDEVSLLTVAELPAMSAEDMVASPAPESANAELFADTNTEAAPVEPPADFWSLEETFVEESVAGAESVPTVQDEPAADPFTWLHSPAAEDVAVAATETEPAAVEMAGNIESESKEDLAAAVEMVAAAEEQITSAETFGSVEYQAEPTDVDTAHDELAESESASGEDRTAVESDASADVYADLHPNLNEEIVLTAQLPDPEPALDVSTVAAAIAADKDSDVDDALSWEMDELSSEINSSIKDSISSSEARTTAFVSQFEVTNDPEEVEFQREVASGSGIDWPDSAKEVSRASGVPDMSHMDLVEDGATGDVDPAEEFAVPPLSQTPAVFITETMAQLYEQQGYLEMSAAVYRQLADRDPNNDKFKQRMEELDRRIAGRTEPAPQRKAAPAEEGDSARDFFSSLVRVPLRPRLARPYVSGRADSDQDPNASIANAGTPAREATSALSLESVFRNGSGSTRPGSAAGAGFSFDQFFVTGNQAPPTARPAEREQKQRRGQETDEIEQFNSWLEGLKRS